MGDIMKEIRTGGGQEALGIGPMGLRGNLFIYFVFSLLGAIVFLMFTDEALGSKSLLYAGTIPLTTYIFLKLFLNNRPPHYLTDKVRGFLSNTMALEISREKPFEFTGGRHDIR